MDTSHRNTSAPRDWPLPAEPAFSRFVDQLVDEYENDQFFNRASDPNEVALSLFAMFVINHPSLTIRLDPLPIFLENPNGKFVDEFSRHFGDIAESFSPGWSASAWACLIKAVLIRRYAGTAVFIKKNPARQIRADARKMNAKQLMEKHGVSRSYAYKVLKEIHKK